MRYALSDINVKYDQYLENSVFFEVKMRYFKRFGDFGSGFCCFMAWLYLFGRFMSFAPSEEVEGFTEKLKLFLSEKTAYPNLLLFILGAMFLTSAVMGTVLVKYPHVSALFTLPPLALTFDMIRSEYIKEYPMLYAFFGITALAACVLDCIALDGKDGGNRTGYCAALVSASTSLLFFTLYSRGVDALAVEDTAELGRFDLAIRQGLETSDVKLLAVFAAVYLGLTVVGVLLRDIYFIDALLALPPFVALIYMWNAETLDVHAEVALTFAGAAVGVRLIAMILGRASYGERKKKKDNADAERSVTIDEV